jgi:signal transduction histidine kinase
LDDGSRHVTRPTDVLAVLLDVHLAERRAMAEALHDDAVQVLVATTMRLELFGRRLNDPVDQEALLRLTSNVRDGIDRLRRLIGRTGPADPTRGLSIALHDVASELAESSGVVTHVDYAYRAELDPRLVSLLTLVAQATVTAAGARDRTKNVSISVHGDTAGVRLTVTDDGTPAPVAPVRAGERRVAAPGLEALQPVVELVGGEVSAEPAGTGTAVTVWLPLAGTTESGRGAGV